MTVKQINKKDFAAMEQRYRTHFINSLSGFKSANLVGTVDSAGNTNLSIVSSVVHLGANPPLIAFINRPHTVTRDTLENIYSTGFYTINHVSVDYFKDAHHTSARYPSDVSEFDQTQFEPIYTKLPCPYVTQSKIKMGIEFKQKIDIELNGTVMVIGEIVEVLVEESIIADDGKLDLISAETVAVSGLDEYHFMSSLGRLPYAKPSSR